MDRDGEGEVGGDDEQVRDTERQQQGVEHIRHLPSITLLQYSDVE